VSSESPLSRPGEKLNLAFLSLLIVNIMNNKFQSAIVIHVFDCEMKQEEMGALAKLARTEQGRKFRRPSSRFFREFVVKKKYDAILFF
jgi:hypothetical protein